MMDKSGSVVLPFTRENIVKVEVENNKYENIEVDTTKYLQSKVIECEKIISGLKTELEQARDTTVRLNKELCYTKRKFENEKNLILKDHLSDMMTWKIDMCRAFYFVKWSGKHVFNRYWSVTKQRLPICTKTSKVVYDKIQSVGHTV